MKFFVVFFLFSLSVRIQADVIVVSTGAEIGTDSLSNAIAFANSNTGADTIVFQLESSDVSFDASQGIFIFLLTTPLPDIIDTLYLNGLSQQDYGGNTNTYGPEICIRTDNPLIVSRGFGIFAPYCRVEGFIINGFQHGILLSEQYANDCRISNNYVGVNATADAADPNTYGIVLNNNVSHCVIKSNIISGNTEAGLLLKRCSDNQIDSNQVGVNISGSNSIANRYGILLDSSANNEMSFNIVSGNLESGILISGRTSVGNIIRNNIIGADSDGLLPVPNLYGVTISKAAQNIIGSGNLISGNSDIGILLSGKYTRQNVIKGNLIGTDISGTQLLSNHKGIVIKSLANSNLIGGFDIFERNIISGNLEIGIYIEAADSNRICGNFIGTDISGMNKIAIGSIGMNDSLVQGNGVEFNILASHNILGDSCNAGRNIISGHKVYGVVYYGHCNNNTTINNFIGTDVTGQNPLPNATGICFDCASNHNDVINCVLSGNIGYGLFYVTRGTEYNRLLGCKIGTDSSGTIAVPNDIGMVVSTGAAYNTIGGPLEADRNIFSGNVQSGLMITNQLTECNRIENNFFGTDISGTQPLPNLFGMLITTFASKNMIFNNLVSGNSSGGIVITEQADSNDFMSNKIGTDISGLNPLPNGGCGVFLDNGAHHQRIGTTDSANIIAYHNAGGILVKHDDCLGNRISGNRFRENNGPAIDIFPFGTLNANDSTDVDQGPSNMLNSPIIIHAQHDGNTGFTQVSGIIDTPHPEETKIQIYMTDATSNTFAQGWVWIGEVIPDSLGAWTVMSDVAPENARLTAICLDLDGNTSEFSAEVEIISSLQEIIPTDILIYPNPCNDFIIIDCDAQPAAISLQSLDGKIIFSLEPCSSITQHDVSRLDPGIYIVNVNRTTGHSVAIKIIKN